MLLLLTFSNNNLQGSIPNLIGNCRSLEELFLANNKFSGSIPVSLGDVKGLEIIDLSSTNFQAQYQAVSKASMLFYH